MTEWRSDMENAPRRKPILLVLEKDPYGEGRVKEGYRDESGVWWLANDSCSCCHENLTSDNMPTAWMPLPPPEGEEA